MQRHVPVPYCEKVADGVFTLPLAKREIDFLTKEGDFGSAYTNGAASFEYVGRGCRSLVLELPLFTLDTSRASESSSVLGARLSELWEHFEADLASVFPCESSDYKANLLLSSPREFWERRKSDGDYVRSVAGQIAGWEKDAAMNRYLGLVFSMATQYSQMARALGRKAKGHDACFAELSRIAHAVSLIDEDCIACVTDGVITALVEK